MSQLSEKQVIEVRVVVLSKRIAKQIPMAHSLVGLEPLGRIAVDAIEPGSHGFILAKRKADGELFIVPTEGRYDLAFTLRQIYLF